MLGLTAPLLANGQETKPPWYADKTQLLVWIDGQGQQQPIATPADWQKRRDHIVGNMQLAMGRLPEPSRKVPPDVQLLEEVKLPGVTRRKITFAVEPGDRVPAYLLIPDDLEGKVPAVLCLHPTSSLGKGVIVGLGPKPNRSYALELAQRGYVTLSPDYPNMGDYQFNPYERGYASATMKAIWNHMVAVDLLESLPEVDPGRIGCIGHSLGGHNTMFLGVFDTRIKVMVSSCGFNRFAKYYAGDLTGWSHEGYMPRIASEYGKDPRRMPFDFTEVVAALAPRPFFVNAPTGDANFEVSGVRDCIAAARPIYELLGAKQNLVAVYPEAGHDFPTEVRREAYAFIGRVLGG
ncbi:MAG: acetylxylan esterase, partial [Planctomycetes bacterium RBG_13_63_9]